MSIINFVISTTLTEKPKEGFYFFTDTFKAVIGNCDNDIERQEYIDQFFYYMEQYKKLLEEHDGVTVYFNILNHIVEQAKFGDEKAITCTKGCNFCCHLNVDVTEHEAQYIDINLKERNIQIDEELFNKQADVENWTDLPYKDRKCVFLNSQGECGIYEFRPLACRKYYIVDDPQKCNSEIYPEGQVAQITYNMAECITSAMLNCSESGRLQTLLKNLRQKDEQWNILSKRE
jgi:Fe-S-cluster containining protein